MERIKRLFTVVFSIVLALCVGLIPFCVSTQQAKALSPDYDNTLSKIYYFYDYYPSIDKDDMATMFGSYNAFYDEKWLDECSFNELVYAGNYFSGFAVGCTVIIDLKTFKPDSDTLNTLFHDLHENKYCKTVFITPYEQHEFSNDGFSGYVDKYLVTNLGKMRNFVMDIHSDLFAQNNELELTNTTILVANRLIHLNRNNLGDIDQLAERSPFLRLLYDKLYAKLYGGTINSYSIAANELYTRKNIRVIVHLYDNEYVDILKARTFDALYFDELKNELEITEEKVCAVGFWRLDSTFYNLLLDRQGATGNLPVYIMPIEPIRYGSGLSIISYDNLASIYEEEYNESQEIINELDDLLGQE